MDLVNSCKDKLAYFRIKELKDVLTQLGLSKQGKKQDLVDRILAILSDEQVSRMWAKKNAVGKDEVAKLVEDTYRKMQVSGATDLASKGQGLSDSSNVKFREELEDSYNDMKIRCPCGSTLQTETMLKCDDPKCQAWQHVGCVIIPEKPMEGIPPAPDPFYCEICRLSRADPFWVNVAHPLLPVKLTTTSIPNDGTNPVQSVEKTFQLTRADKDMLSKPEYEVQAWCILLNDKVSFRMQWPQFAELHINGMPVRAINRPGSQLLGANGRDDGPVITPCTKDGINKISLTGVDARIFCLGIRIVKRRTIQQILSSIPKESDGECFEDALARVRRCIGGGATDNADSDSDLEVVADFFTVNLRCPMSGSRMKVAGRFKPCAHMGCFDLDVFVEMNQRSRKWQCPICLKNYSLENVIIDPYFNRITSLMQYCGEDVTEIQVKPDGCWRVKPDSERGVLAQWHNADGTLCVPAEGEVKPKIDVLKQIKQEGISECHSSLKLQIKNRNGVWEVSKPDGLNIFTSGNNRLQDKFEDPGQQVIMSSSATGSGRDGEDASVNQDGGGNFDFPTNPGPELDSISLNIDSTYAFPERNTSAPIGDAEVIVLSDSEEENDHIISSGALYNHSRADSGGISFPIPTGIPDSYPEDSTAGPGGSSCLGLFSATDDDFGMPGSLWQLPPGGQSGPGFQFFGADADVSDALADLQHNPMNCPTSMNGYTLGPEAAMGSGALVPDSSIGRPDTDMNDGLVDNPLAFSGDDPSLQIFLPTRSTDASAPTDLRSQAGVSNGIRTDDWISLSLGGSSGGHVESPAPNGLNTRQQLPSKDGCEMESLTDTASLLLGMHDGRSDKTSSRQRSDSPFSFPRGKRSVRPRLYLSIDSDSE